MKNFNKYKKGYFMPPVKSLMGRKRRYRKSANMVQRRPKGWKPGFGGADEPRRKIGVFCFPM